MIAEGTLLVRYTVTGGDAVYAIPFRVYKASDVAVTWSSDGRTETELALGKDYSVQLVATGGAELRLEAGVVGGAVPAGATLAIASAIPETQEADFSNTATVNTGALETQLDREVQMIQQLHTELKRAVKVPAASSESPEELLQNIYESEDNAAQSAAEAAASAAAAAASANAADALAGAASGSAAAAVEQRVAACSCAQRAETAAEAAEASADRAQNTLVLPPTATTRGAIRVGHGLELVGGADGVEDVLQPVPDIAYSASEAAVAVKAVTLANFVSYSGARLCLVLSYTNTATAPALSVNNGEAMPILWGGTAPAPGSLVAGIPYLLICDGTAWNVMGLRPDGTTTTVDATGLLSALGGNLRCNTGEWITESGEWLAPATGWYEVVCIGGGGGGGAGGERGGSASASGGGGGGCGLVSRAFVYLAEGSACDVVVGSGGAGAVAAYQAYSYELFAVNGNDGGSTSFSVPGLAFHMTASGGGCGTGGGTNTRCGGSGGRNGGTPGVTCASTNLAGSGGNGGYNGTPYGGGGGGGNGGSVHQEVAPGVVGKGSANGQDGGESPNAGVGVWNGNQGGNGGNGGQGAVCVRYYDPARAAGPAAVSAFALSRKAARAAQPAAVNLYDPETGQGSVWREEDVPAKLAEGLITQEAWQELCAQQAAEAHAAWLADPDTGAERFRMLRSARDARLAVTDYLVAPDYPLASERKAAVITYRQALRDLPAQDGAPWDGGGELTPWPEMPASV